MHLLTWKSLVFQHFLVFLTFGVSCLLFAGTNWSVTHLQFVCFLSSQCRGSSLPSSFLWPMLQWVYVFPVVLAESGSAGGFSLISHLEGIVFSTVALRWKPSMTSAGHQRWPLCGLCVASSDCFHVSWSFRDILKGMRAVLKGLFRSAVEKRLHLHPVNLLDVFVLCDSLGM